MNSQEAQYSYPYHYLPEYSGKNFRQHRYWSWGYRYLGRIKVAFDLLRGLKFDCLLDIGCGDGRFLMECSRRYGDKKLAGIDISQKAVSLAEQLNPELHFERRDIMTSAPDSRWDVITLLEVIEHVQPESLPGFINSAAKLLRPGGHLVITVPHLNEKLTSKHYQHFNAEKLRALLARDFNERLCTPFDHISPFLKFLLKLMGGSGMFFIITHQGLNNFMYKYYMKKCLYGKGERRCRRIAYLAQKRPDNQANINPGAN